MRTFRHDSGARCAIALPPEGRPRLAQRLARLGFAEGDASHSLAVVDWSAPGAEAALRAFKAGEGASASVALAVVGSIGDAGPARAAGADDFVLEGADDREIALRLEGLLRTASARRERGRRERELSTLLELTARCAEALDVIPLLQEITRRLAEELSIARCALVLLDESLGEGHIVVASDNPALVDVRIDLARYPEIREAARSGRPLIANDAIGHPLLEDVRDSMASQGIAALAAVPLVIQKKVFGVLLLRAPEGAFTTAEINFAWTLANAMATALRNAQLLEGLRGKAERAASRLTELVRYEAIFRHISDGIAILDRSGAIASLNPAGGEILRLEPRVAVGRPFASFATPPFKEALRDLLDRVRRGIVCRDVDIDVCAASERVSTLSVCGSSISNGDFLILSFRDLTSAREMERALRKTTEFMERVIDIAVEGVIAVDELGGILVFNKSAEHILGYRAEEVVGRLRLGALLPDRLVEEVAALFRNWGASGPAVIDPTRTLALARGGNQIPALLSAAPILEGEVPTAAVVIFSDLREKTRLEAQLSQAEEQLAEAERQRVIVELAGAAAHALNQPLTCVLGYAQLLQRRFRGEAELARYIDLICQEGARLSVLVRKIGKITRYETKSYVGNSRIFDLDKAAEAPDPKEDPEP